MASADKVPMLAEGHRKLTEQVRHLKNVERPAIVEAIEAARAHGDLSENAEYHAAKERQGHVEATIADLEDQLSRAMVIDPSTLSGNKVVFGATVTLVDGVFPEYVEGSRKLTPAEEFPNWEAGVRGLYEQMTRIDVTPTWVKVHDFETRIPRAVEELARSRFGDG